MLVLGDSFGWGFGVELDERFSEILEKAHPDWEIINASVGGYGTDQQFLFLKERGAAFKPDVVLLLFCVNDFEENTRPEEHWHFKPLFVNERGQLNLQNVPVPGASAKQMLQRFFLGSTYLGPKLNSVKHFFFRALETSVSPKPVSSDEGVGGQQGMQGVTHLLIKSINALCIGNDSEFVMVSVPMNTDARTFLQKLAEEVEVPYLSLDEYFGRASTSTSFPHDGHWNAAGHEIAATAIDTFLSRLGVFDATGLER